MLQHHRKALYQDRFRLIAEKNPKLLNPLPNSVRESLQNFLNNETDENWAIFESRLSFYAHEAKNSDPQTNLLISLIHYDIIYDNLEKSRIEEIYTNLREKTDNTPYELPSGLNYGDILKQHLAAARLYNASSSVHDSKYNILQKDAYPGQVTKIFQKNISDNTKNSPRK